MERFFTFDTLAIAQIESSRLQSDIQTIPTTAFIVTSFSAFVQDAWKVNRGVTMTYGLRWEIAPGPRVSVGEASVARGVSGGPEEPVPTGQAPYRTEWSNVAPRVGIAWQALDPG